MPSSQRYKPTNYDSPGHHAEYIERVFKVVNPQAAEEYAGMHHEDFNVDVRVVDPGQSVARVARWDKTSKRKIYPDSPLPSKPERPTGTIKVKGEREHVVAFLRAIGMGTLAAKLARKMSMAFGIEEDLRRAKHPSNPFGLFKAWISPTNQWIDVPHNVDHAQHLLKHVPKYRTHEHPYDAQLAAIADGYARVVREGQALWVTCVVDRMASIEHLIKRDPPDWCRHIGFTVYQPATDNYRNRLVDLSLKASVGASMSGISCSNDPVKGPSMAATFANPAHARRFAALASLRVPSAKLSLDGSTVKVKHDDQDSAQLFALASRCRKMLDRSAASAKAMANKSHWDFSGWLSPSGQHVEIGDNITHAKTLRKDLKYKNNMRQALAEGYVRIRDSHRHVWIECLPEKQQMVETFFRRHNDDPERKWLNFEFVGKDGNITGKREVELSMAQETYGVQTQIPETPPAPQSPPPTSPAEKQTTPPDQQPAPGPAPAVKRYEPDPEPETPPPPKRAVIELHFLRQELAKAAYEQMRAAGVPCKWDGEERIRALSGGRFRKAVNDVVAKYKGSPVTPMSKVVIAASMESKIKPWQQPGHPRFDPNQQPQQPQQQQPSYPRTPLDDKADQILLVMAGAAAASVVLGALHQLGVAAFQSGRNIVAKITKNGDRQKVATVEHAPGVISVQKKSRSGKRRPKEAVTQQVASMSEGDDLAKRDPNHEKWYGTPAERKKMQQDRSNAIYITAHFEKDALNKGFKLIQYLTSKNIARTTGADELKQSGNVICSLRPTEASHSDARIANLVSIITAHGGQAVNIRKPGMRNSYACEETPTQAIVRLVVDFASPYLADQFASLAARSGFDVAKSSKWSLTMTITSLLKSAAHKLIQKYHGRIESEKVVTPAPISTKEKIGKATKVISKKNFHKSVQLKPDDTATSRRRPGAASMSGDVACIAPVAIAWGIYYTAATVANIAMGIELLNTIKKALPGKTKVVKVKGKTAIIKSKDKATQVRVDQIIRTKGGQAQDVSKQASAASMAMAFAASSYPWNKCIEDATKRYGSVEQARRVCGAIRRGKGAGIGASDVATQVLEFALSPVVAASALLYLQRKGIRCYKTNGDKTIVCKLSEKAGSAIQSLIKMMDQKFDAVVSKVPGVQLKPAEDWGPTSTEQKVLKKARGAIKKGESAVDAVRRGVKFVTPQNQKEWALATVVTFSTVAAAYGAYKLLVVAGVACKTAGKKLLVAIRGPQDQSKLQQAEATVEKKGEVVSVQPGKVPMSAVMSMVVACDMTEDQYWKSHLRGQPQSSSDRKKQIDDAFRRKEEAEREKAQRKKEADDFQFKTGPGNHARDGFQQMQEDRAEYDRLYGVGAWDAMKAKGGQPGSSRFNPTSDIAKFIIVFTITYGAGMMLLNWLKGRLKAKVAKRGNKFVAEVSAKDAAAAKAAIKKAGGKIDQSSSAASLGLADEGFLHVRQPLGRDAKNHFTKIVRTQDMKAAIKFANKRSVQVAAATLAAAGVATTAYGLYLIVTRAVPAVISKLKSLGGQPVVGDEAAKVEQAASFASDTLAPAKPRVRSKWLAGHGQRVLDSIGTGDYEHIRTFNQVGKPEIHSHMKALIAAKPDKTLVTDLISGKARDVRGFTKAPAVSKNDRSVSFGLTSPITSPVDSAETVIGVMGIGGALLFALAPTAARRAVGQLIGTGVTATREGTGTVKAWLKPENLEQAKRVIATLKQSGARFAGRGKMKI